MAAMTVIAPRPTRKPNCSHSQDQAFVRLRSGDPGRLPPPVPGYRESLPASARAMLEHSARRARSARPRRCGERNRPLRGKRTAGRRDHRLRFHLRSGRAVPLAAADRRSACLGSHCKPCFTLHQPSRANNGRDNSSPPPRSPSACVGRVLPGEPGFTDAGAGRRGHVRRDGGATARTRRAGPGHRHRQRSRIALHARGGDQRRHAFPGQFDRRLDRRRRPHDRPPCPSGHRGRERCAPNR